MAPRSNGGRYAEQWKPCRQDPAWDPDTEYRIKPQPDPYAELKAAHAAGKIIQVCDAGFNWDDLPRSVPPLWCVEPGRYRVKPEPAKKAELDAKAHAGTKTGKAERADAAGSAELAVCEFIGHNTLPGTRVPSTKDFYYAIRTLARRLDRMELKK